MRRRFNDDYYSVPVQEWEDKRIPQVVLHSRMTWIPATAIAGWIAVGQFVENDWRFWVNYAVSVLLVSSLFTLVEEVNETVGTCGTSCGCSERRWARRAPS